MSLEILTSPSMAELEDKLDDLRSQFKNIDMEDVSDIEKFKNANLSGDKRLSLVIDGPTLGFVLSSERLSIKFFRLGLLASSVVCCRVSPK